MSVEDPVLSAYEWLVVVGAFAAFFFGFGTGSNDVANAFGTSVGAKTLTLKQAVIIAAIFEFTGAMVLGRVSTATISGGIASTDTFARQPEAFAYGMVCALTTSAIWQVVASYFEMNVSSTHSIIGAIIGFSLIFGGKDAVNWQTADPASFPPYKGVVPIIVSWFFSPIFTAVAAAGLFFFIRWAVLRRQNAYHLSFWLLPFFVLLTVFICIFFVFTKGAKKTVSTEDDTWTDAKSAWVAACVAAGTAVLVAVVLLPILKYRSNKRFNDDGTLSAEGAAKDDAEAAKHVKDFEELHNETEDMSLPKWKRVIVKSYKTTKMLMLHGTEVDIHKVVEEDELVGSIHKHAEVFDPKAEYAFQYLQVFSAICVVFAHGAGEVGYMAGPLASIWFIYTEGNVPKNVTAPAWVVFIGAFGLVIGLATYGYNVTRAMGVRLSKLSPTRGFCAELSTAFVIMICSQYGLPTSSSQCITGGIIGVGLLEGKLGVNWLFFGKIFASWVATLFIVGLTTAALFAQGVYSPCIISGNAQVYYENQVSLLAQTMSNNYRTSMMNFQNASNAGVLPLLPPATLLATNTTLGSLSSNAAKAASNAQGTVAPEAMMNYLYQSLAYYQADSVLTVGQVKILPKAVQCSNNITQDITAGVLAPCPNSVLLPASVGVPIPAPLG